jgi:hypothetical protein
MALYDYIPNVFGQQGSLYEAQGLLTPQESAGLSKQSNIAGLLGTAAALAAGMSKQGPRRSGLQNVLGALSAGYGASGQAYQGGIEQMANAQKLAQMKLQMQQNAQKQSAISEVLKLPEVANDKTMQAWVLNNTDKALEYFVKRRGIADFMAKENAPAVQPVGQPNAEQMAAYQQQEAAKQADYMKSLGGTTPNILGQAPNIVGNVAPMSSSGAVAKETDAMDEYFANLYGQNKPVSQIQNAPTESRVDLFPVPAPNVTPDIARLEKSQPPTAPAPKQVAAGHPLDKEIRSNDLLAKYWAGNGDDATKAKEYQAIAGDLRKRRDQDIMSTKISESLGQINPLLQPLADVLMKNAGQMSVAEQQSALMEIRKKNADFKVNTEKELRNEFTALPEVKEFTTVETAFKQINAFLSKPSAANDLAAATKFMKLLDPGSVVRESELGMAMKATGAIDSIQNYFQKLQNGQMLNPEQRADFKRAAQLAFGAAQDTRDKTSSKYVDLANSYNVDANNVVLRGKETSKPTEAQPTPQRNTKGWQLHTDANGNRAYVSPDGTKFEEIK